MRTQWKSGSLIVWLVLPVFAGCTGEPAQSPATGDAETSAETQPENAARDESVTAQSRTDRSAAAADTPSGATAGRKQDKGTPDQPASSGAGQTDGITLEPLEPAEFDQMLDKYKGQVVLVDFWATWCTPCVKQFPHTVEMSRKYAGEGLAVVSVSMDAPAEKELALEFLQKQGARFENRLCTTGVNQKAFEEFGIDSGIPHYQVYDRAGNLAKELGNTDPDNPTTPEDIEQAVLDTLSQPSESAGS